MNLSSRFLAPGEKHWLGTDQYGRDIFSRVTKGSTNSIVVGLVAVTIGMSFGILLGSLAAFYKGWLDEVIMRISDVLYGFRLSSARSSSPRSWSPGITNSMIAIGVFNIPIFARVTRATSLSVWERDFVTSGKAIGRGKRRYHLEIYPSQYPLPPDRSRDGSVCDCHPGRGWSELSWIRNTTSPCQLGKDAQRGPDLYGNFSMAGHLSWVRHRPCSARIQSPWRWIEGHSHPQLHEQSNKIGKGSEDSRIQGVK